MQRSFSSRRHFIQLIGAGAAAASIIPLVKLSHKAKNKHVSEPTTTIDSTQIAYSKQKIESLLLDSALKNLTIVKNI